MELCGAEKPLKNPIGDASLEGNENTEPPAATALALSDRAKGSRPISVDTVKRKDSPAVASPRDWEEMNETVTTPSTPSTTSPLPSPTLAFTTAFVPPEATEFEAMAYHQTFLNDQTSSDDELDSESPILIATPVNLLVPPTKPNLIFITPSPFHSGSYRKDIRGEASVSTQRSTRNLKSGSVKNYSRPRVDKNHRRKASSLSSFHTDYSSHDLSISTTGERSFVSNTSSMSSDRRQLDRNATTRGARSKRNRNTFVHDRSSAWKDENENLDFSHQRVSISYPDVGTWSRNVNSDETHMYSAMTPQSDVPPVPPLTPTSIPIPSSPSRAGTPTTETASISPRFYRQDHYHARTTSDKSTETDNSIPSPSNYDADPHVVPARSLRRHRRAYTKDRAQSVRSLRMDSGDDIPYPPSSINFQCPTYPILNNPSRKSLPFPYQHIYQPIPGLASSPSSPLERPPSIRSMSINHDKNSARLTHTNSNSTSNLSMYSFSYADSESFEDDNNNNVDSPRARLSNNQRITRKKSIKYLRETKDTMVGRVMGKNLMNIGLSWKRKNSTGSSSGMATPTTPYDEGMVRG